MVVLLVGGLGYGSWRSPSQRSPSGRTTTMYIGIGTLILLILILILIF